MDNKTVLLAAVLALSAWLIVWMPPTVRLMPCGGIVEELFTDCVRQR